MVVHQVHLWIYKIKYIESSVCINNKIPFFNDINEENSSHKISLEIIDHVCDGIGMDLDHIEKEVNVTYIHSTNETNQISINDDANVLHK